MRIIGTLFLLVITAKAPLVQAESEISLVGFHGPLAEKAHTAYSDGKTMVRYVLNGDFSGTVLKTTVTDIYGRTKALRDVDADKGTECCALEVDPFKDKETNRITVKMHAERNGKRVSNEAVITMYAIRRPEKELPDTPLSKLVPPTDDFLLSLAKNRLMALPGAEKVRKGERARQDRIYYDRWGNRTESETEFVYSLPVPSDVVRSASLIRKTNIEGVRIEYISYHPANETTRGRFSGLPAFTEVRYELRPTASSHIHSEVLLPLAEVWDGRYWGAGNGGAAGVFDYYPIQFIRRNSAVSHTDMGTGPESNWRDPEVWTDFGSRSIHLTCLTAKQLIAAFYGRPPHHSYYFGESTGGGSGIREAEQFPEDYDGVVAQVPCFDRTGAIFAPTFVRRFLHDKNGKRLFTPKQLAVIQQASLDWYADKDEPWARGKFISDPRFEETAFDGIWKLAVKADPSLDNADLRRRIYGIHRPFLLGGRQVHPGLPFGIPLQKASARGTMLYRYVSNFNKPDFLLTDEELLSFERKAAPYFNVTAADLKRFKDRGGKLLIDGGWLDEVIFAGMFIDYWDKAVEKLGSREAVDSFVRLYLLAGRKHNPGKHIGMSHVWDSPGLMQDWVENGVAPDIVRAFNAEGKEFQIAPYPDKMTCRDGVWRKEKAK